MSYSKTAIITGVNGQDGSYLAELLLEKNYRVIGLKRRTSTISTDRIDHLMSNPNFVLRYYDLLDSSAAMRMVHEYKPDEVYNLAAQSHVAVSFELPQYTSDGICKGTLNWLDAIRILSPQTRFYQASSSEMYGDSTDYDGEGGFNESSKMLPVSPYAVSKLHAHNMVRVYRNAYNLYGCSGILFNHESPRRGETFVTRKITIAAAKIFLGKQDKLSLGNLDAKRDWGFSGDYVEAMWMMLQHESPDDYVVATNETYTVRHFLEIVFSHAGLGDYNKFVVIDPRLFRPNEVPFLKGNPKKAREVLGWKPKHDVVSLAKMMFESDLKLLENGKLL